MRRPIEQVVAVCETIGNWSGLLRRQLATNVQEAPRITVLRVETLDELSVVLEANQRGCFALQFDETSLLRTLDWLRAARARYPAACFFGILKENADGQTEQATQRRNRESYVRFHKLAVGPVYEAGASLVVGHPLETPGLTRMIRRYFSKQALSHSADTEIDEESVWLSLPWRHHATPRMNIETKLEE